MGKRSILVINPDENHELIFYIYSFVIKVSGRINLFFFQIAEKENSFQASQAKIVRSTCKHVSIIIMFFVSPYEMQNCAMAEFTSTYPEPGAALGCGIYCQS